MANTRSLFAVQVGVRDVWYREGWVGGTKNPVMLFAVLPAGSDFLSVDDGGFLSLCK